MRRRAERRRSIGSRRRSAGDSRRLRRQSADDRSRNAGERRLRRQTGDGRRKSISGGRLRTTSGRGANEMHRTTDNNGGKACHIVDLLIAKATCSYMREPWSRLVGSHKYYRCAVVLSKPSACRCRLGVGPIP
jgi:hypothetical protein